jgi:hypothetical protein
VKAGKESGRLARALNRAGFDVVAVDPKAPDGRIFRRCRIEDLDEAPQVSGLLRARDRIIVYEFAWDQFDAKTANWFWMRRAGLSPRMRRHLGGRSPSDCTYRQMRRELDRRFTARFFAWTPYLHEYPGGLGSERQERRFIEAGEIRPMGFRFVGQRR